MWQCGGLRVQAVDMLEQAGGVMDKEPLRQAVLQLEEQVRAGRPQPQARSEHFERFKWLLGLPNNYYAADWEE